MSSPSVSYAESVLSHLEKVQQLPVEIQVGIARRVESCIKIARAAKNEAVVANIASSAMEEQAKAIGHGTMDPQWAAPAIAEAWCYATMSLTKGYLKRTVTNRAYQSRYESVAAKGTVWSPRPVL